MPVLRQREASSERKMPALRQCLKRPETYLATLAVLLGLFMLDSYRSPAKQISGGLYVRGVLLYRIVGHPLLEGRIQCRYRPTCSEYSIEAVRAYGIRRGLVLTVRRIRSCQRTVPMGTLDPLPPPGANR